MSCTLFDVHLYEHVGDELFVYDVEEDGSKGHLWRQFVRHEPRNIEQWLGRQLNNLLDALTDHDYLCGCGFGSNDWAEVVDHLEMYPCRSCGRLTYKSEGWNYLCPPCDKQDNPDYHHRNPGWHYR